VLLGLWSLLFGGSSGTSPPIDPNWLAVAPWRRFLGVSAARSLAVAAPLRSFSAKAGPMPFIADLSSFDPTEKIPMSIDFSGAIPTGDSVLGTPTATIAVYQGVDPNASALLSGTVGRVGNVATQFVGPGGVPGTTYRLTITITTASGAIIAAYVHALCAPVN
jgi:hypothetical protein